MICEKMHNPFKNLLSYLQIAGNNPLFFHLSMGWEFAEQRPHFRIILRGHKIQIQGGSIELLNNPSNETLVKTL